LVDALALRHLLPQLGQFFADPSVVKVLHGCDKDVLWLQRDCGLYLVNCFDTHVAAKALNYPALSLAHLLKMHCGVNADKKHQLSDWRARPLPAEMQHYAKEDTHFLLYIFDRMRLEVSKKLGKAGLEHVFDASRQLCLARYEKESFDPLGYRLLFKENATSRAIPKLEDLSSVQDATLSALWDWRDRTARREDESCAALMSNSELLRIGLHMPQSGVQLEQLCGPLSPHTRKCTSEILKLIADTISVGPTTMVLKKSSALPSAIEVPAHNFSSPHVSNKKAKSVQPAAIVVPETIYTFTPAILSSPDRNLTSPVLRADEVRFLVVYWLCELSPLFL
jgi:exosome complex exonuclease RRP6